MPETEAGPAVETGYAPVSLSLAERSLDLWPALEAAQFARIVNRDPPSGDVQDDAMRRFIAIFAELAESWETVPVASRVPALDGINRYLVGMRENGIFVHAAAVECAFSSEGNAAQSFPMAVLNLGRDGIPVVTLMIPQSIDVTGR